MSFACCEKVLVIESESELVQFLYLADEYDMPELLSALLRLFPQDHIPRSELPSSSANSIDTDASSSSTSEASIEITLVNARLFLELFDRAWIWVGIEYFRRGVE